MHGNISESRQPEHEWRLAAVGGGGGGGQSIRARRGLEQRKAKRRRGWQHEPQRPSKLKAKPQKRRPRTRSAGGSKSTSTRGMQVAPGARVRMQVWARGSWNR